jgi:putative phosphoesterase
MSDTSETVVGLISDTHGVLPAAAARALAGVERILHAGDVEDRRVLDELARIAPVTAVRGNMDRDECRGLPRTALVEIAGLACYVLHDIGRLDLDPFAAGIRVVVHGHTHRAEAAERGGVLFVNPGSATRPRGGGPASVARLRIGAAGEVRAEIVPLEPR